MSSSNLESSETNPPATSNQSESPVKAIDDPCNYLNVTEFFDGLQDDGVEMTNEEKETSLTKRKESQSTSQLAISITATYLFWQKSFSFYIKATKISIFLVFHKTNLIVSTLLERFLVKNDL